MNWPKLSIVIYSNADPGGCVRILADCERLTHDELTIEVVLVLQGLTEKVEAMLRDIHVSYPLSFVSVGPDVNRAQGRNLGFSAAQHEIILFLDSELEVSPELALRHLEAYQKAETTAVMGEIFLPKFVKKNRWFRYLDGDYRSARRWSAQAGSQTSPPLRYVNTSNFSVRRDVYQEIGGHNEAINHPEAEDIDLAYRISNRGPNQICFQPEAIAYCLHAPLKASLKMKYGFGKEGIPKLLELYPDLYPVLPSRFVKITGFPSVAPVQRMCMNLLFSPPVMILARGMRVLGPEFVAFRMMRYMLQVESVKGVKASGLLNK